MTISKNTNFTAKAAMQKRIKRYLNQHSTTGRIAHSSAVAKLAKKLCIHYNVDPFKGVVAGLGHDIARELSPDLIMYYAEQDNIPFSALERKNVQLLHGRAGAVILEKKLDLNDEEILAAVRDHVLGKSDMSVLAKIIFAADFLEPKRNFLPEKYRKSLLLLPLDKMLFHVLSIIFSFLKKRNYPIAEQSIYLYKRLKESINLNEKN